jgi:hypothetical protein
MTKTFKLSDHLQHARQDIGQLSIGLQMADGDPVKMQEIIDLLLPRIDKSVNAAQEIV